MAKKNLVSVDKLIAELSTLDARRQAIVTAIRSAIAPINAALRDIETPFPKAVSATSKRGGRRKGFTMSKEARAKISAAQKARWAKTKRNG